MRLFANSVRENGTHSRTMKTADGSKTVSSSGELYYERDNLGTRQETMAQAIAYWKKERPGLSSNTPFTLFTFPSADAAEKAMLELPFIHKATDSGKLICDRRMTFGCYATKTRGALKGQYEVMVTGSDLTEDELFFAESVFSGYQGRCKVRNVPSACADSPAAGGNAALVRYAKTIKGNDGISTYEIYSGPDKASAFAFLSEKNVSRRYYYIIVDTPEGSFGRDCIGFYQE